MSHHTKLWDNVCFSLVFQQVRVLRTFPLPIHTLNILGIVTGKSGDIFLSIEYRAVIKVKIISNLSINHYLPVLVNLSLVKYIKTLQKQNSGVQYLQNQVKLWVGWGCTG